ncbi:unnamed protein product [Ectocarpus sp. CCAP 1310/34]|nr:unnamed protein product [Ectocarpus sp. CCAP 1310/34]
MDPVRSDSVDQGACASSEMKDENKLVMQQQELVSGEQPELSGHSPATEPPIPATDASSSSRLEISNRPRVEAETLAIHAVVAAGDVSSVEAYIARNADKILKFRRPSATATTTLVPPTSGIAALLVDPAAPKSDADSGGVSPLEVVNLRGRTPLHTACIGGHIRVVELLLAAGADANAFDNAGFSPLHRCAQSSDLHSARALLDRNKGGGGASPTSGDVSVVAFVNSDVDVPTRRGDYRAIHLACYAGSADMVNLLARRGADVSAGDKWGASPLHRACLEGHLEAARAVLDAGAEVDSRDSWKSTPLHRACHSGHADIVNLLLRRGAATSAKDDIMQRPGQSFDNDVTSERRQVIAALLKESEKSRSTTSSVGLVGNTPCPGAGAWSRARNTADPRQGKERSPSRYVPPAARAAAAAAAAAEAAAAAAASGPTDSAGGGYRDTPELKSTISAVQPWRRKTSTWMGLSEDRGPDVDIDGVVRSDGSFAAAAVGMRGEKGHGKFGDGFAQAGSGPGHEEEEEDEDDEDFDNEIFELEVVGVRDGVGSETGLSDCHPTTGWGLRSFDGAPKTAFPSYHN